MEDSKERSGAEEKRVEELERRLQKALQELEERERERERWLALLYTVTHDLKAPVASVHSYLRTLLRKASPRLDDRLVQIIKRCILRLDQMLELISGLLELSRLESGGVVEEFREVDWEEMLGGCLELANSLAEPKAIRVHLQLARPLPRTFGSEVRLGQVVMNLLTNAVNYTPREGRIRVKAFRREDELVIQVEDNGVRIAPDALPRIFDEFFRADPNSSEGTGLGLTIAKRIVELHQGRIWAESPISGEGRGTRVSFALPLGWSCPINSIPRCDSVVSKD